MVNVFVLMPKMQRALSLPYPKQDKNTCLGILGEQKFGNGGKENVKYIKRNELCTKG